MAVPIALCLLALILRLLFIAEPSLRGDEALSVIYAQESLSEIVRISRYVSGHPPLFYGLLHFWIKVAGTTEFAARFYSTWWGVLAVPLVYALGRALIGARGAMWAALLLVVNPFYVWHAQDIRSYSMLTALALIACWVYWRALQRPAWRNWCLYAASGIAVVHCHYFGAFLILAHGLFVLMILVSCIVRPRSMEGLDQQAEVLGEAPSVQGIPFSYRAVWRAALSFAAIALSLFPWLWLARSVVTGEHGPGARTLSLGKMFQQTLVTFGIGYWRETWGWGLLTVGLVLLLGWGAWSAFRQHAWGAVLLLVIVGLPLICLFILSRSRPLYRERYLAFSAPAYALLIGSGLAYVGVWRRHHGLGRVRARLWRTALIVCALFLIGFNAYALSLHFGAPAYAKSPEWRQAASFIEERMASEDVVILNHQDQAFLYYYDDPGLLVLPTPDARDADSLRRSLQALIARYDRVWLLPDTDRVWDEDGFVRWWLGDHGELVLERAWRGVLVLRYHTPRYTERERAPLDARLDGGIRLLGYALRDEEGRAVEQIEVERGGTVRLTLYWRSNAPIEQDYVVFTHLLDGTGWLRGQQDNQPRQGTYPTRAWTPGKVVIDAYRIPVAMDAPPGEAMLEVGMYEPISGKRLWIGGCDSDPEQRRVTLRGVVEIVED